MTDQYPPGTRITTNPAFHAGRFPGIVVSISRDTQGTLYAVKFDAYAHEMHFREQDLKFEEKEVI